MNKNKASHTCPVELAGGLDNSIRKFLQNPHKILKPYIKDGMTILDVGCGPGYFSVEMAKLLNGSGKVMFYINKSMKLCGNFMQYYRLYLQRQRQFWQKLA